MSAVEFWFRNRAIMEHGLAIGSDEPERGLHRASANFLAGIADEVPNLKTPTAQTVHYVKVCTVEDLLHDI